MKFHAHEVVYNSDLPRVRHVYDPQNLPGRGILRSPVADKRTLSLPEISEVGEMAFAQEENPRRVCSDGGPYKTKAERKNMKQLLDREPIEPGAGLIALEREMQLFEEQKVQQSAVPNNF